MNAMSNEHAVLSIQNLSVQVLGSATGEQVVRNIGFTIAPGETVCVVGESGSGKSVTSLAVMGLLPKESLSACSGQILIDGEDILKATPERLRALRATRMAMVFQEPMTALNPVQRVGQQIDEVLRVHTTLSKSARRA